MDHITCMVDCVADGCPPNTSPRASAAAAVGCRPRDARIYTMGLPLLLHFYLSAPLHADKLSTPVDTELELVHPAVFSHLLAASDIRNRANLCVGTLNSQGRGKARARCICITAIETSDLLSGPDVSNCQTKSRFRRSRCRRQRTHAELDSNPRPLNEIAARS